MKVHRSNFTISGFVAEASLRDLAPIAAECGVPLLFDFGSGLMLDLSAYGLSGERVARDAVREGATLTLMSGDKLLGGPQAGIIVGSAAAIDACRRNPLCRALRVDKLTLAALEATLELYRDPARALAEIPALAMLTAPADQVRARAESLGARLGSLGYRSRCRGDRGDRRRGRLSLGAHSVGRARAARRRQRARRAPPRRRPADRRSHRARSAPPRPALRAAAPRRRAGGEPRGRYCAAAAPTSAPAT